MQTKILPLALVLLTFATAGCAADTSEGEGGETTPDITAGESDELTAAVAIKGKFRLTELWYHANNKALKKTYAADDILNQHSQMNINLDGNGSFQGYQSCNPTSGGPTGLPEKPGGPKAWDRMSGLVGVFGAVLDAFNSAGCTGLRRVSSITTTRRRNILGDLNTLPDNLGVLGDKPNHKWGNEQCRRLKSVQYLSFNFGAADGCMGYSDKFANQLTMIIKRTGDLNLQVAFFERVK